VIGILEYESAEAEAVQAAFSAVGADAQLVNSIDRLDRCSKVVLPPTTSFRSAVRFIRDRGFVTPLMRAIDQRRPVLGMAQGLHLLFDVSYEEGQHTGLGVIPGKVAAFDFEGHAIGQKATLPHRGWNQVHWSRACPLFEGIESGERFYFDHSFHAEPLDIQLVVGRSNHGIDFSAAVWSGSVVGTQFLPVFSDNAGARVLRNFAAI
jgi:glutamine amidotransferase